ncbi:hypothetical protein D3C85_1118490 [compost metagenome]
MNGLEVAILQAQRGNVAVHQANKGVLATGGEIGHCHTGIVTGLQVDTADQLRNRHLHAWFQEHQGRSLEHRVAGGPGIVTHGDQIGFFKFTGFHGLTDDVAGHHFCQACWITARVSVLFCQHFARVVIDQDVGFRINLRDARDHGLDIQVISVSG